MYLGNHGEPIVYFREFGRKLHSCDLCSIFPKETTFSEEILDPTVNLLCEDYPAVNGIPCEIVVRVMNRLPPLHIQRWQTPSLTYFLWAFVKAELTHLAKSTAKRFSLSIIQEKKIGFFLSSRKSPLNISPDLTCCECQCWWFTGSHKLWKNNFTATPGL